MPNATCGPPESASRMTTRTAAALLAAGLSLLAAAPTAQATSLATISPGERIDYTADDGSGSFCTTGYVYTGTNDHAYAITAGHCHTEDGGRVIAQISGARGHFVATVVAPARTGGPDYGLIDFGPRVASRTATDTVAFAATASPLTPNVGDTVCHLGVSSGTHCGAVAYTYGGDQFMTTGMPASVAGDSGGPVWITDDDGTAHIVGIWLGEKSSADNNRRYGRFASLRAALNTLT